MFKCENVEKSPESHRATVVTVQIAIKARVIKITCKVGHDFAGSGLVFTEKINSVSESDSDSRDEPSMLHFSRFFFPSFILLSSCEYFSPLISRVVISLSLCYFQSSKN